MGLCCMYACAWSEMFIVSPSESAWFTPHRRLHQIRTLQHRLNHSSTSASPARLWSSASRQQCPLQSSCPSTVTTQTMRTHPVLHQHCRARPHTPPSHPASAVSRQKIPPIGYTPTSLIHQALLEALLCFYLCTDSSFIFLYFVFDNHILYI